MSEKGFVHIGGPTEDALFDWMAGRLRPQAASWIADHVAGCHRCGAAIDHVRALRAALDPPEPSPFQMKRDLAAVRRRLERPSRRLPWLAISTATVFAACALVAFVGLRRPPSPARDLALAPKPAAPELRWSIQSRSGSAEVEVGDDHLLAQANQPLPSGGVLAVQPGARVQARWGGARVWVDGGAGGARVRLVASRGDERRIQLVRGRALFDVDPLAPGQTLAVVTADSEVTVHGTVFLVDAGPTGTKVACTRGLVRVASRTRTVDVPAGARLDPGAPLAAPIDADAKHALDAMSAPQPPLGTESLDVFADVTGAQVLVDGVPRGVAPLSIGVEPGLHRLRVLAPGRLPLDEQVQVAPGTPALVHAELEQLKSAVEPPRAEAHQPSTGAEAHKPSTSGDPLAQARADVMAGNYARALERLEPLRRHGNATRAARAALLEAQAYRLALKPEHALPLLREVAREQGAEAEQAQLQLAQTLARDLSDPRRAAEAYAEAQRRFPNGIFREEVAFRYGEALLNAGETKDGVSALERYLTAFPSTAHAEDAHLLIAAARRDRLSDCAGALPHLRAVAGTGALKSPRAELALIGEARCLTTLGRAAEARAAYARYLQERPRGRFADEAHDSTASAHK